MLRLMFFLVGFVLLAGDVLAGESGKVELVLSGHSFLWVRDREEPDRLTLAGVGTQISLGTHKPLCFMRNTLPDPLPLWIEEQIIEIIQDRVVEKDPDGNRIIYAHRPGTNYDWGWALIRSGYAYARKDYEYERKEQYFEAEKQAKRERIGYWQFLEDEPAQEPNTNPAFASSTIPSSTPSAGFLDGLRQSRARQQQRLSASRRNANDAWLAYQQQQESYGYSAGISFGPMSGSYGGKTVFVSGHNRITPSGGYTYVNQHFRSPPGGGVFNR